MRPLNNFNEAKNDSKGVVILGDDRGGQVYLTCPMNYVKCDEESLKKLLREIDDIEWDCWECNEGKDTYIAYLKGNPGDWIGGDTGGRVEDRLWINPDIQSRTKKLIKKVINGK